MVDFALSYLTVAVPSHVMLSDVLGLIEPITDNEETAPLETSAPAYPSTVNYSQSLDTFTAKKTKPSVYKPAPPSADDFSLSRLLPDHQNSAVTQN